MKPVRVHHFTAAERHEAFAARDELHDTIMPYVDELAATSTAFNGLALFVDDQYHDSIGSIAQMNSPLIAEHDKTWQQQNITRHRVHKRSTAVGQAFLRGASDDILQPSRMSPNHLVFSMYLAPNIGRRAAAIVQLAFDRNAAGARNPEETLDAAKQLWHYMAERIVGPLESLHDLAQQYPNRSISDMLLLDVPTRPSHLTVGWDTIASTKHTQTHYPQLRDFLTLAGADFAAATAQLGGDYLRPTGDGQLFAFDIERAGVDINSERALSGYVRHHLPQVMETYTETAKRLRSEHPDFAVRFTAGIGCVEPTTFDRSSPEIWNMSQIDKHGPSDRASFAMTHALRRLLDLQDA